MLFSHRVRRTGSKRLGSTTRLGGACWLGVMAAGSAVAEPTTYDFADPKGVNGVMFVLDSATEPFVGIGGGIAGQVMYDPADPTSFTGTITLDATTLRLVSGRMTDVMHGSDWLNTAQNGTITVTFTKAELEEDDDHDHGHDHADHAAHADDDDFDFAHQGTTLEVQGTIQFGGVTLNKEFEIDVTVLEDGATQRGAGQGDLMVLRSVFTVDRTDLGIPNDSANVAPAIRVVVPIVGYPKAAE